MYIWGFFALSLVFCRHTFRRYRQRRIQPNLPAEKRANKTTTAMRFFAFLNQPRLLIGGIFLWGGKQFCEGVCNENGEGLA